MPLRFAALRPSCCWLFAQKAARRSSRSEVDGLRFSVNALLLADHRLRLLGSPWFDPDAKPRSVFMLVCLFASPGRGVVWHS